MGGVIPEETITKPLPSDYHTSDPEEVEFFVAGHIRTYGALFATVDTDNQTIVYRVR